MLTFEDNLNKFLEIASSQKEVNLIIAQDEIELQEFQKFLKSNGYIKVDRTAELIDTIGKPGKLFMVVQDTINKNIYDFITQYSTGQVELFNRKHMQAQIVTPNYQNLSVLVLVTKKTLNTLQADGIHLLQHAGPAYQS